MFEARSIRQKLVGVIMLITGVVLLITFLAFMAYELIRFRETMRQSLSTLAGIVANSSTAAVTFDDAKAASDVLSALRAEAAVVAAAIYTNAKVFAYFPPSLQPARDLPAPRESSTHRFSGGYLEMFRPITLDHREIGVVYLRAGLEGMYDRLRLYSVIALCVLLMAYLLAYLLSLLLEQRISKPILELADVAKGVSQRKDYSIRATKFTADELGLLTDAFNDMLQQIQQRDVALREGSERLHLALEASQIATWEWEINADKLTGDERFGALFGLESCPFISPFKSFLDLVHPDDRLLVLRLVSEAIAERKDFLAEFRVIWPDRAVHHLSSRGKASYDDRNKPLRMTGVSMDVTEQRRAGETRSFLAAIVESSDDAVIGKDLDGKLLSWNAGAERMFGYTATEIVGRPAEILIPPDHTDEEMKILARVREDRIIHFETVRMRKDGTIIDVSLTVSPIKNATGQVIGASSIARDITERKRAEEEIRRLNTGLEQRVMRRTAELSAANQELEAFAYSVSHDLRAPLRHIDAYADILRDELGGNVNPAANQSLQRIRKAANRMGQLVDDLLQLSRLGRTEFNHELTNLNRLLEEAVAELRPDIGDREIEWRIGRLPDVDCDPGLMKLVFVNLLSNALKYSRPRAPAVIEVNQTRLNDETVIFVRDNGVGFNMKYADKLFGVFQRLHRMEDFEGTGIGLATVERIIRRHGGRVWAEAEVDKGATFYFTLSGANTRT